jgi:hypothetical protein
LHDVAWLKLPALDARVHEPPAVTLTHKFPALGETGLHPTAGDNPEFTVADPAAFDAVTATYSVWPTSDQPGV